MISGPDNFSSCLVFVLSKFHMSDYDAQKYKIKTIHSSRPELYIFFLFQYKKSTFLNIRY